MAMMTDEAVADLPNAAPPATGDSQDSQLPASSQDAYILRTHFIKVKDLSGSSVLNDLSNL